MRLLKARVEGFQSFKDSGDVEFEDGVNLLIGQNNAGKSALLRALQVTIPNDRHRSPSAWLDAALPSPQTVFTFSISGEELREVVFVRNNNYIIPSPEGMNSVEYVSKIISLGRIEISVIRRSGDSSFKSMHYPSHGLFVHNDKSYQSAIISPDNGQFSVKNHGNREDTLPVALSDLWSYKMFYFSAERMNVGISPAEPATRLDSNAQNLPSMLFTLNGNRGNLFKKLVGHIREVFSTIGNLSVSPRGGNLVEVRLWPTEAMERVELSFPLLQSGTGVSQVMAILTAVMTIENAVIIIDEINSFLHPAAVKTLLRILQTEYYQHQYIISTHAPEVMSFSNPRTVHLVKREGYDSTITRLDLDKVDAFREVAEHLGISMADVFAADRIVWVEGPTEELCFPFLYQELTGESLPRGTIFTSVMATGDFMANRRDKELVYQIYMRISKVAVPLVVSVAFSFDSENLKDSDKARMVQDSLGAMHFLPRRHIECYLVNPIAIAAFITERDFTVGAVESEVVVAKLTELAATDSFKISEWKGNLADSAWLAKVDAANLIAKTCAEMSEQRVTFNKKDDTLWLCQRVLAEAPSQIVELSEYIRTLVEAVG